MIEIKRSPTADTRTCDYTQVTKGMLLASSAQHIDDVKEGMCFFAAMLVEAAAVHDRDKLADIDGFHRDFVTGFKQTTWWDRHRKLSRHHLINPDGVPADVNLIDVLEMVVDCVMAGMARGGEVYPIQLPVEVLEKAFQNTVEMLKREVTVVQNP